jgi:hypothetical protein
LRDETMHGRPATALALVLETNCQLTVRTDAIRRHAPNALRTEFLPIGSGYSRLFRCVYRLSRHTFVSHSLVKAKSLRIEISCPRQTFLNQGKNGLDFVIVSWSVHHHLGMPIAVGMLFAPSGRDHVGYSITRETAMDTRITDTVNVDWLHLLVGRCE